MMIDLTKVSNTILELGVGKWYVTVLCFVPVYGLKSFARTVSNDDNFKKLV